MEHWLHYVALEAHAQYILDPFGAHLTAYAGPMISVRRYVHALSPHRRQT